MRLSRLLHRWTRWLSTHEEELDELAEAFAAGFLIATSALLIGYGLGRSDRG